ncbi:MAG: 1,4-alpha-glucan branching enzyme [Ectothiorhodospiraceae bacterium]|nr:1,4-alpha-glucan branching enzyme [Ectothiorhodospiraceae bacterium]
MEAAVKDLVPTAALEDIYRIIFTEHHDPYTVLGIHKITALGEPAVSIRAFLPLATEVYVLREFEDGRTEEFPMERVHVEGFYEYIFLGESDVFRYKLKRVTADGETHVFYDSYAFLPQLTDYDLHLFGEGNHFRIYDKLGSHFRLNDGIGGVHFAVWAPSARSVSVIGDFNGWDRRRHAMRVLGSSGVWEMFVPGLDDGTMYKFEVKTRDGHIMDKTDPYARYMEVRPRTASIVKSRETYSWSDQHWMDERSASDPYDKPVSIYEIHLASWKRHGDGGYYSYREIANELVPYIQSAGFTHVELLPIMEHPFDGSWGYQVTGYYAPTSRHGSPDDFRYLIDKLHQAGIGVLLDWVPAHFPKDLHALGLFDGTHVYEHSDPRKGEHLDWGTFIFNYGRHEVKNFLIANALFWLEQFHLDGIRIDAVASMLYLDYSRNEGEWVPNEYGGRENLEAINFLRQLNWAVHANCPGAMVIAEESTSFTGVTHPVDDNGLGFDYKWNMGWMHDTLEYFEKDPIFRKYHHNNLTFSLLYAFTERFMLPISHDEVVYGKKSLLNKMPGDYWQKFANMRLFLGYMWTHPGKKLLFMGQEFGQWNEWNHDTQLDWNLLEFDSHNQLFQWLKDLNGLYRDEKALHEVDFSWEGFEWVDLHDNERSILAYERFCKEKRESVIVVCNFTPMVYEDYRLGVHVAGSYREVLNSDSHFYGGSGVGNGGTVNSENIGAHEREHSLTLRLPPLGMLILKRVQ